MHGVQNLIWDEKIAESAQKLVDAGVFKHSTAASRMYVDDSGKKSQKMKYKGENLWMCTKDHTFQEALKFAVNSWYSEIVHGRGPRRPRRPGQRRDRRALHPGRLGTDNAGRMRRRKDGPRLGPR